MIPILFTLILLSSAWIHPGVVVSQNQLDFIKSQIQSKSEPIFSAYEKALNSKWASKSWKIQGPPSDLVIDCGSHSNPNHGCTDENNDAAAAVLQAILYHLTDEQVYADNAIKIMNSYSKLTAYTNSNAKLQAGWGASKWARAAELIVNSNAGWNQNDIQAFKTMITQVSLPLIRNGSPSNSNWELTMIDGMIGFAVFLEDKTLYDQAIKFWKERVQFTYYNVADGNQPNPAPRGHPSWYGQTVFDERTNGVAQETCRNFKHQEYSIASTFNAAETAYIQGDDLYTGLTAERLRVSLEFHAFYLLGNPAPSYLCNGQVSLSNLPTFDIGYNALANRMRMSLPETKAHLEKHIWTNNDPVDFHMMIYETLTHGGSPKKQRSNRTPGAKKKENIL